MALSVPGGQAQQLEFGRGTRSPISRASLMTRAIEHEVPRKATLFRCPRKPRRIPESQDKLPRADGWTKHMSATRLKSKTRSISAISGGNQRRQVFWFPGLDLIIRKDPNLGFPKHYIKTIRLRSADFDCGARGRSLLTFRLSTANPFHFAVDALAFCNSNSSSTIRISRALTATTKRDLKISKIQAVALILR